MTLTSFDLILAFCGSFHFPQFRIQINFGFSFRTAFIAPLFYFNRLRQTQPQFLECFFVSLKNLFYDMIFFFFVFAGVPGKVRWKPPGNHQLPHGKPALHSSAYSSMMSPRLTFKSLARVQYSLQNNTEGQNWAGTPCGFLLSHIVKICLCDCQSERRSHLKAAEDEKDSWRRLFQSSFRPASLNSESDESSTFQNKNPVFVLPLFCYVKVTVSFLRGFDVVTFPSLFQRGRALDLKTAAEHAEREREKDRDGRSLLIIFPGWMHTWTAVVTADV